jgi:hypothetical protein
LSKSKIGFSGLYLMFGILPYHCDSQTGYQNQGNLNE